MRQKCSKKDSSKSHLYSEMFASSQLWQEKPQLWPKAVFYYEWVAVCLTRCCFNWHRAEQLWCMKRCGGRERRAPHYRSLFLLSITPPFRAMEAAGRACQPCEGSRRDKAWAERRAEDVTKSNTRLSQTGGNSLKEDFFNRDEIILHYILWISS